ncbi:putative arabinan endo-alpha-l-arabinosidase a [Phaeomoniella chlamydospora]|uniref:Endo-1,5-alpha-L-arabinanase A n=1 Tax=Phaeomoniella chlamydospora TaxID=158046 RepID=A0A0G2ET53_PHACM|nr:putative arabinan endo-alpha-l-arabinosidase a [Phaeomoniella chlamydospora]
MLPEGSSIQIADGQEIWAPDVMLIDDVYHVFYAVSKSGFQNSSIGLATSTTLDVGTWTDHGTLNIPLDSRWNKIDPNIFHAAADQPYYFVFGSSWDGIFQTQLDPASGFLDQLGDGPVQKAYNSTTYVDSTQVSITEGGYQFWVANATGDGTPYYYLFFSSGACCNIVEDLAALGDEYKVMVCRSTSPTGPFADNQGRDCQTENGGTLVLASHDDVYAPGGQGVFEDEGRVVMYYHYGMCRY